jgi:hypothetical protein
MEPNLFYNCTQPNCNRKYKTKEKFIKHLSLDHKLVEIDTNQCIATTIVKHSKNTSKIFSPQVLANIPSANNSSVNNSPSNSSPSNSSPANSSSVNNLPAISLPQESELPVCTICYVKECDTVVVPCGHLSCCYDCVNEYHTSNPDKGCPICRTDIICLTKIYK